MRARTTLIGMGGAAALSAALLLPEAATAAPQWAPAGEASIHPGVQTSADGQQCTANFVFTDGTDVYLGQAAHCTASGGPTETDGCTAASKPLGTEVRIAGAEKPGILAYNSWITMQERKETDVNACNYNDFALVKVDPADVGKVNPTVPKFGGPVGLDQNGADAGEQVFSYQDSELRFGIGPLKPKQGVSLGNDGDYGLNVLTATPGIPGDSGSALLSSNGEALGILSTFAIVPIPASNGVSRLAPALAYANAHGGLKEHDGDPAVILVYGDAFSAPAIPVLGLFF